MESVRAFYFPDAEDQITSVGGPGKRDLAMALSRSTFIANIYHPAPSILFYP